MQLSDANQLIFVSEVLMVAVPLALGTFLGYWLNVSTFKYKAVPILLIGAICAIVSCAAHITPLFLLACLLMTASSSLAWYITQAYRSIIARLDQAKHKVKIKERR